MGNLLSAKHRVVIKIDVEGVIHVSGSHSYGGSHSCEWESFIGGSDSCEH